MAGKMAAPGRRRALVKQNPSGLSLRDSERLRPSIFLRQGTMPETAPWWPRRGDSQSGRQRARACRERPRSRQLCRDVVRQPYWSQIRLSLFLLLHCQCPILRPLATHFLHILYMRWPANKAQPSVYFQNSFIVRRVPCTQFPDPLLLRASNPA